MGLPVFLTDDATKDLEEIVEYIAEQDSRGKADHVLDRIESAIKTCPTTPTAALIQRNCWSWGFMSTAKCSSSPTG